MRASTGQLTGSALQALLRDGTLAGDWILDPDRSGVRLTTKVFGFIPVNGVFGEVSGSGAVAVDGTAGGSITIGAASIDTKNTRRDTHLRSADFFETDRYPDIIFAAADIRPAGPGVAVTGALTVHGRTQPLSFEAEVSIPGDGEVWLEAEVRIDRGDFGLTWNQLGMVPMGYTLIIHAVFTRR